MAGISAAYAGQGPFISGNLNQSLLNLQLLLATVAIDCPDVAIISLVNNLSVRSKCDR